jgi:hypothetical protein
MRVVPESIHQDDYSSPKDALHSMHFLETKSKIMFLANNRIGASDGLTGKRCGHGKRERATIPEPRAHAKANHVSVKQ